MACLAIISSVIACRSANAPDLSYTRAVVYGTVLTPQGARASNVAVAVRGYLGACPALATGVGNAVARTNSDGAYRAEISTPTAPATQCIAVTANPSGNNPATVAGATVRFKPEGETPYDSARVDVVLP